MGDHVHAEHRRHVPADTRGRREQQRRTAQQPGHHPARRPVIAATAQSQHRRHVQRGQDDRRRAEDQIEAPVEQDPRDRGRSVEVVADLGLGNRRQPDRGWRWWRSTQAHGDPECDTKDGRLDQRQPDQRTSGFRVIRPTRICLQRSNSGAPLTPADQAQHAKREKLGGHQAPITGGQQVGERDPYQCVDNPAERHCHPAPQRDRGETPCRQGGVLAAAHRVRQQGQQTSGPQAGRDQVDQQAVGGQVMRTAGRGVTGQPERNQRHQRREQQHRRPGPAQHGQTSQHHDRGQHRGPAPGIGDVDQAGQ